MATLDDLINDPEKSKEALNAVRGMPLSSEAEPAPTPDEKQLFAKVDQEKSKEGLDDNDDMESDDDSEYSSDNKDAGKPRSVSQVNSFRASIGLPPVSSVEEGQTEKRAEDSKVPVEDRTPDKDNTTDTVKKDEDEPTQPTVGPHGDLRPPMQPDNEEPTQPTVGPYGQLRPPMQPIPANAPEIPQNGNLFQGVSSAYANHQDMAQPAIPSPTSTSGTPASTPGASPAVTPDLIKQYLTGVKTNNTVQGLKDAQQRQDNAQLGANLARAGDIFSAGMGTLGSHQLIKPTAQEFTKDLGEQAGNITQQYAQQVAQEKQDPNSEYSQNLRKFMAPVLAKMGFKDSTLLDGMSAAQMTEALPVPLKLTENLDAAELRKSVAQDKIDRQNKETAEKTGQKQDKSYADMGKAVESFRGNTAVQQASQAIRNGNIALSTIVNSDPNTLTPQIVNNFTAEVAKMAQGGSPTQKTINDTKISGLGMSYAELMQKITSEPNAARQGAMIKMYEPYIRNMMKVSQDTLDDYQGGIAKGYLPSLKDEHKKEFILDHPQLAAYLSATKTDIQNFADQHKHKDGTPLSYDEAKDIIGKRAIDQYSGEQSEK